LKLSALTMTNGGCEGGGASATEAAPRGDAGAIDPDVPGAVTAPVADAAPVEPASDDLPPLEAATPDGVLVAAPADDGPSVDVVPHGATVMDVASCDIIGSGAANGAITTVTGETEEGAGGAVAVAAEVGGVDCEQAVDIGGDDLAQAVDVGGLDGAVAVDASALDVVPPLGAGVAAGADDSISTSTTDEHAGTAGAVVGGAGGAGCCEGSPLTSFSPFLQAGRGYDNSCGLNSELKKPLESGD
jgi:hypothetical protein